MGICPGCGKTVDSVFCDSCRPVQDMKIRNLSIKFCTDCHKVFIQNKWQACKNFNDGIARYLESVMKKRLGAFDFCVEPVPLKPGIKKTVDVEITCNDGRYIVLMEVAVTYCEICSRKQGDYYEGTLQLRNVDDEIIRFANAFLAKNNVHISRQKNTKNGYDLTVTSQKTIRALGSKLVGRFGGKVKVSPHIYSRDSLKSKDLYRINVLYEGPGFKVGDVINAEGPIKITKLGKNVYGVRLSDGKKISLVPGKFDVMKIYRTTVSKAYPNVEVLHPETYQSVPVANPKEVKLGEKVRIVIDNKIYLV